MVWSKQKDLALLKEVTAEGVFIHKQRSREQGMQGQKVADNMSVMGQDITTRAVRDHYKKKKKKYRARMAREERATGEGGAELTEDEMLLEELIYVEDETDR
jgi:repressor of nif and glnA expression